MVVEGIRVVLSDGEFPRGGFSRKNSLSPNSNLNKANGKWKAK